MDKAATTPTLETSPAGTDAGAAIRTAPYGKMCTYQSSGHAIVAGSQYLGFTAWAERRRFTTRMCADCALRVGLARYKQN